MGWGSPAEPLPYRIGHRLLLVGIVLLISASANAQTTGEGEPGGPGPGDTSAQVAGEGEPGATDADPGEQGTADDEPATDEEETARGQEIHVAAPRGGVPVIEEAEDPPEEDEDGEEEGADTSQTEPLIVRTPEESARRERRHVLHNSIFGPVGGYRVVDAGSGAAGAFRVRLLTGFSHLDGWVGQDQTLTQFAGSLSVSWTPFDFLEIYGSAASYLTDSSQEFDGLRLSGDTLLGFKLFHAILPWLYAGGDVWLGFRNMFGDAELAWETTSVHLRVNLSADLRELEANPIPLIARLNVGYLINRYPAMVRDRENASYANLPAEGPDARRPLGEEDRHLLSPSERFALQLDRLDRLTLAVGIEVPIELTDINFTVSPILEYVLEVPIERDAFDCPPPSTTGPRMDRCLEDRGTAAFRQSLGVGVGIRPILRGLHLSLMADIGLAGMRHPAHEVAVQVPYRIMFGFAFAYDTLPDES